MAAPLTKMAIYRTEQQHHCDQRRQPVESHGGTVRCGNTLQVGHEGHVQSERRYCGRQQHTILITEGNYISMTAPSGLKCHDHPEWRSLHPTRRHCDGSSNTISVFEGTCTVNGGTYNARDLYLYTGGSFYWNSGDFSCNTLNLRGGNFYEISRIRL